MVILEGVPAGTVTCLAAVASAWLWGLLPDDEAVLSRWARELHASASSAFSLLATPIGEDCADTVQFAPPEHAERVLGRDGDVTWLSEEQVAQRLGELKEDSTAWRGRSFTGQFSLAGAQAKTALLHEDGRWEVPSGSTPTTHILKPAVAAFDDRDINEHLCLDAARRAGLTAARSGVTQFTDETAVVVERHANHRARRNAAARSPGRPRASPERVASDAASALPYGTHERKLRLAMKVGSSYDVHLERNRWPEAAAELGLDPDWLVPRARELARLAPEAFASACRDPSVAELRRPLPARLLDLIDDRSRRCLRLLGSL